MLFFFLFFFATTRGDPAVFAAAGGVVCQTKKNTRMCTHSERKMSISINCLADRNKTLNTQNTSCSS
jgi:hypothetical protein